MKFDERTLRLNYHPVPWQEDDRPRGARKVIGRWESITSHCDLRGATVLDLGCSGGFMTFRAAELAARVIGVDADADVIERNRRLARERGLDNVEFIHGRLTPDLIGRLPKADFAFFLSVFHHMLVGSEAYDWNPRAAQEGEVLEFMAAVAGRAFTLVFEVGQPHENLEWAAKLPDMGPDPASWIARTLLEPFYQEVVALPPPDLEGPVGWLRGQLHFRVPRWEDSRALPVRVIRRVIDHDTRDARHLYFARRPRGDEQPRGAGAE